jgi:hypothetical protein
MGWPRLLPCALVASVGLTVAARAR